MKTLLIFPFFYLGEIVSGAMRVARDVLTPKPDLKPVLLHIPVDLPSDAHRLLLACLVSMTPGTVSVDQSADGSILTIHSLYGGGDPAGEIEHIQKRYVAMVAKLRIPFTGHA